MPRTDRKLSGPGAYYSFSIGTGANRDYATIADFLTAFDNTLVNIYGSEVVVTLHNDTGQDQWVIETGPITISIPSNVKTFSLTVDDDDWHKGDRSKGVVLKANTAFTGSGVLSITGGTYISWLIERLIIEGNNQGSGTSPCLIQVTSTNMTGHFQRGCVLQNLMLFGGDGTYTSARA